MRRSRNRRLLNLNVKVIRRGRKQLMTGKNGMNFRKKNVWPRN